MKEFWLWFSTGLEHITDFNGYDHILFVALLTISYCFDKWKKLVFLITAFTIGHSISLALSVVGHIEIRTELVEFLIAFSIVVTAAYQLYNSRKGNESQSAFLYFMVLFFGLVHGLGFSFLLKAMLGKEESIAMPLLFFNLGLEVGQLLIVLAVVALNFFVGFVFKIPFHLYKFIFILTAGLLALKISIERLIELL